MATLSQPFNDVDLDSEANRPVPRVEAGDEMAMAAVQRFINWENQFRWWHMQRMALNWRFYRGDQWIDHFTGRLAAGSNGLHRYSFRRVERKSFAAQKRPVDNRIAIAADNDVARLTRQEFIPSVKPTEPKPQYEKAAQLARDITLHDMRKIQFGDYIEDWAYDLYITGTCVGRSVWDETVHELTPVGSPDARICVTCQAKFSSPRIPVDVAEAGMDLGTGVPVPVRHVETMDAVPAEDGRPAELEMKVCPICDVAQELREYDVPEHEVDEMDALGRQLGDYVRKGSAAFEHVSVFDYFPENGGVIEPRSAKIHGQATVRDLDWIFARFPGLEGKIEPEQPAELMRHHPMLGDRWFSSAANYDASAYKDTYSYHALVRELHMDQIPIPGFELGRSIVVIGDHVPLNDTLAVEVRTPKGETRKVPRIRYAVGRSSRIRGEFWGRAPVDNMISPQRRLNELDAQEDDMRERGMRQIFAPPGVEIITRPGDFGGLRIQTVDNAESPNWSLKDWTFDGVTSTQASQYHEQRQIIIDSLIRHGAPNDIESGMHESGVKTATEMLQLAEESQVKREPRIRALTRLQEDLYSHHLSIRWAFQAETGELEKEIGSRVERIAYRGMDLLDQQKVTFEQTQNQKSSAFEMASLKEAHEMGLIDPTSPLGRDKALEILKVRKDINEEQSVQIDRAEGTWIEWMDSMQASLGKEVGMEEDVISPNPVVPPVDETLDDHQLWHQILGKRWQDEDALELQREMGWNEILATIPNDWEQQLLEAEALEPAQTAIYGSVPPEQWQVVYEEGVSYQQKAEAAERDAVKAGLPPSPQPVQQMTPPPKFGFLPKSKQQKVLAVWAALEVPIDHPLVQMRARIETHRLLFEREAQELAAGQAVAEAPGAPQGGMV